MEWYYQGSVKNKFIAACSAGKVMVTVIWGQKAAHTVKSLFIDKIRYCIACVSDMWFDKYFSQIFISFRNLSLDPFHTFAVTVLSLIYLSRRSM